MIFLLIPLGLIVGSALLIKNAKNKVSIGNYVLVLIIGIISSSFDGLMTTLSFSDGSTWDGGIVGWCATIFGIYCIVWSIIQIFKFKKDK